MFDKAASTFTSHLVTHMKVEGCVPKLFPVQNINLDQLNKRVRWVRQLKLYISRYVSYNYVYEIIDMKIFTVRILLC